MGALSEVPTMPQNTDRLSVTAFVLRSVFVGVRVVSRRGGRSYERPNGATRMSELILNAEVSLCLEPARKPARMLTLSMKNN